MELIPKSVVEKYDVGHLHELATHMTASVAHRTELMTSVNAMAAGQDWAGLGRLGQDGALAQHTAHAEASSAALAATGAEAVAGAETLYTQKQELMAGLAAGTTAGFEIDDEYNVSDPFAGTPAGTARASAARALQTQLKAGAQAFTATEHSTAQAIRSSISAVDFKTDKGPPPSPPHPVQNPDPNHQEPPPDTKDKSTVRQILDGFEEVVGGTALTVAGVAGIAGGVGTEIPSGGTSTVAVVAGVGGVGGGVKMVIDGLDELKHLGNG